MENFELDIDFVKIMCEACEVYCRIIDDYKDELYPLTNGRYVILGLDKSLVEDPNLRVNNIMFPSQETEITLEVGAVKVVPDMMLDTYRNISEFCKLAELHAKTTNERHIPRPFKIDKRYLDTAKNFYRESIDWALEAAKKGYNIPNFMLYSFCKLLEDEQTVCFPGNIEYPKSHSNPFQSEYHKNNRISLKKLLTYSSEVAKLTLRSHEEYRLFVKEMKKHKDVLYWCKRSFFAKRPLDPRKDRTPDFYYRYFINEEIPVIYNKKDEGKMAFIIIKLRYPYLFKSNISSLKNQSFCSFTCGVDCFDIVSSVAEKKNIDIYYDYSAINQNSFERFTFFVKKEHYKMFMIFLRQAARKFGYDSYYTSLMFNADKFEKEGGKFRANNCGPYLKSQFASKYLAADILFNQLNESGNASRKIAEEQAKTKGWFFVSPTEKIIY